MSEQRPAWAPGLVLAQVSLRVILPLLAGMIAGLVADRIGQTAPLYALIGLVGGTLVSVLWLRAFIRSSVARMRHEREDSGAAGAEEHEHTTTERS
jgi:positive regulator of sigma E activity